MLKVMACLSIRPSYKQLISVGFSLGLNRALGNFRAHLSRLRGPNPEACGLWGLRTHRPLRHPFLYHTHPKKQGSKKASSRPIRTLFWDACGIESGTLQFHGYLVPQLSNVQWSVRLN